MANKLNRRKFLQLSAAAAGGAALVELQNLLFNGSIAEAQSLPGRLNTPTDEKIVPGVCRLCPSGCGILARVVNGNVVKLEGNPMHPVNMGALCPKGQASPELLYNPDRIAGPLRRVGERGSGQWEPISWEEAVKAVADKLTELRTEGHPEQTVLLTGETRGQQRAFFERFLHAIGSPNLVSHESLNIAAAKLGMYLTQGIYDLPAYDLENSAYVLSFGASLLEAGRSPQRTIAGYAFMRRGRADRGKVVVIDPRQGITGAKADEWIPIIPGTDSALALGIAHVLIRSGLIDSDFILNYSFGFEDFPGEDGTLVQGFKSFVLENYPPEKVETITGVPSATISRLAGEFATQKPAVAVLPGKGGLLDGGFGGIYTAMAVHSLNALVGSIEKPGGVMTQRYPYTPAWPSLPADPVAEAGRAAPRVDGAGSSYPLAHHAYQALADRILQGQAVSALFLYDANPVYETPGGRRFIQAFQKVPFIVSFSSFLDESAQYADLVLPEPTFLERYEDDYIEGLGYPGIALRQPAISPRLQTMNTCDFLLNVAAVMGGPVAGAFPWKKYEDVLQFRLKEVGTDWKTLEGLGVWMTPGYRFSPRGSEKWIHEVVGSDRQNAPRDGRFDFYSRELAVVLARTDPAQLAKAGMIQDESIAMPHALSVRYAGEKAAYPFILNVITLMSLGPVSAAANLPTLQEITGMTVGETWGSWLEMNPASAVALGLVDKDEVWVESLYGKVRTKVRFVKGLHPDVVNLPYNQGHTAVGRWARGRGVNGLDLLDPSTEALSGLAAFTNTRVRIYRA